APLLIRMDDHSLLTETKADYAERKVKSAVRQYEDRVEASIPFKVVLLGNSGVGKTSIVEGRSLSSPPPPATIGSSFVTYQMEKQKVCLQVWDTAGQERFRCMVPMYMRNADAAIIVFDLTNRSSFEEVTKWENELIRCCSSSSPSIVLIGNKADLSHKRVVARGEAVNRANQMHATYVEMSAHSNTFPALLNDLATRISRPSSVPARSTVILSSHPSTIDSEKTRRSCCPLL
ncbi:hypothetical protein PFISCL1PPCAC_5666, partial [Pristionchus fissidentatus]